MGRGWAEALMETNFEPTELLGLEEDAVRAVLEDLASLAPEREVESKAFSDCSYVTCKALGLQVRIMGKADVVFLYNEGQQGFTRYAGTLPEGLQWSHQSKDVILLLGEPSDKYGGGRFRPVGISYETLGLDIQFKENSWENEQNPMDFISVFQRLDPSHGLCELCGKRASFRCGLCKSQRYCSSECQKKDWAKHQQECAGYAAAKRPISGEGEELLLPRVQQASQRQATAAEVALDAMD
ncbi:unnamed protein product [Effrenium voratum]|nr:unnamed protein product [Effrenium voratum]